MARLCAGFWLTAYYTVMLSHWAWTFLPLHWGGPIVQLLAKWGLVFFGSNCYRFSFIGPLQLNPINCSAAPAPWCIWSHRSHSVWRCGLQYNAGSILVVYKCVPPCEILSCCAVRCILWWSNELTVVDAYISDRINARPGCTTLAAWFNKPIRDSKSCFIPEWWGVGWFLELVQWAMPVSNLSFFSGVRRSWNLEVFSSIPRKTSLVTWPSVYSGATGRPAWLHSKSADARELWHSTDRWLDVVSPLKRLEIRATLLRWLSNPLWVCRAKD